MSRTRNLVLTAACLVLGACSGGDTEDLQQFMTDTAKDMQGKVEPLPKVRQYEPFEYDAFELPDPFKPRKLSQANKVGGLQPDLSRPKEPLEAYSLETLNMVGSLRKEGRMNAIVRAPDKAIYHVHPGNYMGQNFGLVAKITDTEVILKELVQDSAGDWTERTSTLTLQE